MKLDRNTKVDFFRGVWEEKITLKNDMTKGEHVDIDMDSSSFELNLLTLNKTNIERRPRKKKPLVEFLLWWFFVKQIDYERDGYDSLKNSKLFSQSSSN